MPCTGDIFNHHNKELVGIKWSCKGAAKLSEQAGSEFVGNGGWDLSECMSMHASVQPCSLAHDYLESQTLTYILPVSPDSLSNLTPSQKHDCRPTNFITTALNCTVLEPSNYSSLRCGRVEKGRKSTEVGAPGLELWENWKQMICPFPFSFLLLPSLSPTPYLAVLLLWLPGTMKNESERLKCKNVWGLVCQETDCKVLKRP